jgi:hypothetical protein
MLFPSVHNVLSWYTGRSVAREECQAGTLAIRGPFFAWALGGWISTRPASYLPFPVLVCGVERSCVGTWTGFPPTTRVYDGMRTHLCPLLVSATAFSFPNLSARSLGLLRKAVEPAMV